MPSNDDLYAELRGCATFAKLWRWVDEGAVGPCPLDAIAMGGAIQELAALKRRWEQRAAERMRERCAAELDGRVEKSKRAESFCDAQQVAITETLTRAALAVRAMPIQTEEND